MEKFHTKSYPTRSYAEMLKILQPESVDCIHRFFPYQQLIVRIFEKHQTFYSARSICGISYVNICRICYDMPHACRICVRDQMISGDGQLFRLNTEGVSLNNNSSETHSSHRLLNFISRENGFQNSVSGKTNCLI